MKMKKTLGILIAASMVLAACGGNSSGTSETKAAASGTEAVTEGEKSSGNDAEYNFTIGTSATKDSATGKTMQYAADLIQEKTEGRIHITCYPDSQLGSDAELVEAFSLVMSLWLLEIRLRR